MLRSSALSHVECCEVLSIAARVTWARENDFEEISSILSENVQTPPQKKTRRQQQDFCNFLQYGTASFCAIFNGDGTAPTSRLSILRQCLLKLGLRCPTESTFKMMTSAWLVATHASGELWNIDTQTKLTFLRHVKTTFDGYRRKAAEPEVYVPSPPADTTL